MIRSAGVVDDHKEIFLACHGDYRTRNAHHKLLRPGKSKETDISLVGRNNGVRRGNGNDYERVSSLISK